MKRIIYVKHSNERAAEFSVRTVIAEDAGIRMVEKYPETAIAGEHLESICLWSRRLAKQYENTRITVNRCEQTEEGIRLEYVKGKTLEECLDSFLEKGDQKGFSELLGEYFDILKSLHSEEKFHSTPEFEQVFGQADPGGEVRCGKVSNIDALFSNIVILEDGRWCMLDYEWTFDFPVPGKYLLYRILFYYFHHHEEREKAKAWIAGMGMEFTEKEKICFQMMEQNFQRHIQHGRIPVRDMFDSISPGIIRLDQMHRLEKEESEKRRVQIYMTDREQLSEEESWMESIGNGNCFETVIPVGNGTKLLRIDPCFGPCVVRNLILEADGVCCTYFSNSCQEEGRALYFTGEDPQISLNQAEKLRGKELRVRFEVEFLGQQTAAAMEKLWKSSRRLERQVTEESDKAGMYEQAYRSSLAEAGELRRQLEEKEYLIDQMKGTKIWKLYRKYRKIISKEDRKES